MNNSNNIKYSLLGYYKQPQGTQRILAFQRVWLKFITIKRLLQLSFISLMLSGCNMNADHCSSTEVKNKLYQQLTEQTIQLTTQKRNDYYDGTLIFGATKVRDSITLIHITLDNIKTINQDPESHLSNCTGRLNASVPPPMLAGADLTLKSQHQIKVADYARQLHIEHSINVFTQDITFSVKPTGKSKNPQLTVDTTAWEQLLDKITTAILLKPTLELQKNNPVRPTKPVIQKVEPLKPAVEINTTLQEKEVIPLLTKTIEKAAPTKKASPPQQNTLPGATIKATSPGFDCSKATKPTDTTICGNAKLSALDVDNMSLYKNAKTINPVTARDIWKASIKSKYLCKTDINCIANVYKKSIQRYQCVAAKNKAC